MTQGIAKAAVVSLLLASLMAGQAGAAPVEEDATLAFGDVEVTVIGHRVVPVRLEQAAVWDLTSDGQKVGGVSVEADGVDLGEHDQYGVALVSRGANTGLVAAVMYEPHGTVVLASGTSSRRGLPRPADDAVACVRCELPPGDYDLFVFGPYRRHATDAAPRLTVHLEGLPDGVTSVGDDAGDGAYIIATAWKHGASSAAVGGGGLHTVAIPLFYDGEQRDGVYLAQATVTTPPSVAGGAELTLTGQVNNRERVGPTEQRGPFQDAYSATAAGGDQTRYETRIAVPTSLDRESPYLYAHGDTTVVNHSSWDMRIAMLWLTTRTSAPAEDAVSREPALDLEVKARSAATFTGARGVARR